jgi:hypothetical protein
MATASATGARRTSPRRVLGLALLACAVLGGAACDDASEDPTQIDEDDQRFGPGDGNDETGPGR